MAGPEASRKALGTSQVAAVVAGARMAVVSEAAQPSARVPEAGQDSSGRRGQVLRLPVSGGQKKGGAGGPRTGERTFRQPTDRGD